MPYTPQSYVAFDPLTAAEMNAISTNTTYLNQSLVDGWVAVSGSWTYASASTITVPSDATTVYQKGDRIRWKQGGGYKYGVIVVVASTLLTILVNTDYTVANSAITDMWYSKADAPLNFPTGFAISAFATTGWSSPTYNTGRISLRRGLAHFEFDVSGTSNSTSTIFTPPVAPLYNARLLIRSTDNGGSAAVATMDQNSGGGGTFQPYVNMTSAVFTASGSKRIEGAVNYEW